MHGAWGDVEQAQLNGEETDDERTEIVKPSMVILENVMFPVIAIGQPCVPHEVDFVIPHKFAMDDRPINQCDEHDDGELNEAADDE